MRLTVTTMVRSVLFRTALCSLSIYPAFGMRTSPRGTWLAEYDYHPYGRLIRETGPQAASCPFRYSTKYRDPDLELYYYGYRWYDASAMKWLTPDPIGERGGANLTAFCSGDPINKVDPLGLEEFELVGLVPRTFDATDVLKQYLPGLDHTIGFRIDPQANAGRGALYVFLPSAYLAPGVLREEAAGGDTRFYREATEEEYAWFFLALWEQNVRENPKLTADLQAVVGLGYQADPRVFAADLGRIWRAYHRGETSKLIVKDAGQRLVFSALFAGIGYSVRAAKHAATERLPPVIIGENMERVNRYAKKVGGYTIDDWLAGRNWTPELNDEFIAVMKAQGRQFHDIGPDFRRRLENKLDPNLGSPPSPNYGRERHLLRDYPHYQHLYERTGKYQGGVSGFDP